MLPLLLALGGFLYFEERTTTDLEHIALPGAQVRPLAPDGFGRGAGDPEVLAVHPDRGLVAVSWRRADPGPSH